MSQLLRVTQEPLGDFRAQGLHKLREPVLLQGTNLAHTLAASQLSHLYAYLVFLFSLQEHLSLKVVSEGHCEPAWP